MIRYLDLRECPGHADGVAECIWAAFWQHKGTPLSAIRAGLEDFLKSESRIPFAVVAESDSRLCGNVLVIDTVGYNDKFWFDSRGTPHTDQLHTVERWTRINYGTLINDFTLDDPGAFSRPVQLRFTAQHVRPDVDLMEFICLEDNQYGLAGGFTPAQPDK